jgi:class 3 adenylate cyclase
MRRTVSILYADVVGSTSLGESLDPEAVRKFMDRYFTAATTAVERHGGAVEKFIGDAVVAVFGVPRVHEDDSLRAVRAADDLRRDFYRLNTELGPLLEQDLRLRVGVNTGEVVVGAPQAGGSFVTGDAVNVAARLEQAAAPGDMLIGTETYALVRDAIDAAPTSLLRVKGKAEPLQAWRLLGLRPGRTPPTYLSTFVGRETQVKALEEALVNAVQGRTCVAVTVIGEPGGGKTRLAEELLSRLDSSSTVLRGRCLPYGEGVTLWPLREAVLQAGGLKGDESTEAGRARLRDVLGDIPDVEAVVMRLSHIAGLEGPVRVPEDLAWSFRVLLETLASRQPLILVVDDLHWAEPSLLDLLEHVSRLCDGAPILLLLLSRPELLQVPGTQHGWLSRQVVRLNPLGTDEVEKLLQGLDLPHPVRDQVVRASGGNPLFAEQLVRKMWDEGLLSDRESRPIWVSSADEAHIGIPPTIHALLAARLDLLTAPERSLLERAAVVGSTFNISVLVALTDADSAEVNALLQSLARKGLVRAADSDLPALGPAYTFVHALVRDTAYAGMAKATRAMRHEQLADWLAAAPSTSVSDVIVGNHLEQACRYCRELHLDPVRTRDLAERAATRLGAAAHLLETCDARSAADLLGRAVDLLAAGSETRMDLLLRRSRLLMELGLFAEARWAAAEVERCSSGVFSAQGRLLGSEIAFRTDPGQEPSSVDQVLHEVLPVLRRAGDHRGLSDAYFLDFMKQILLLRCATGTASLERAIHRANLAGDEGRAARARAWLAVVYEFGPTPADEALVALEQLTAQSPMDLRLRALVQESACLLHAMCGRFAHARQVAEGSRRDYQAIGWAGILATLTQKTGVLEELAGNPTAAHLEYQRGRAALRALGETAYLSTLAGLHARMLARVGRTEEAQHAIREAQATGSAGDVATNGLVTQARTLLLARANDPRCLVAADLALSLVASTEAPDFIGEAHAAAATAHAAMGHPKECRRHLRVAVECFARKGNVVRAAALGDALRATQRELSTFQIF